MVEVRRAAPGDAEAWLAMRCALWPEGDAAEHGAEIEAYFRGDFPLQPCATLLALDAAGRALGFAEASVRPVAEGCRGPRIAYLEGWFVRPEARRQGVGRALVAAVERWGRAQGCAELASDTQPENAVSADAHRASGFEDVGLVRCFRKAL